MVESSLDISERLAYTYVNFKPDGELMHFGGQAGMTVHSWIIALHFGAIRQGGNAYRAFVCMMGFAVALLSISGVWIWWKKRRNHGRQRESPAT